MGSSKSRRKREVIFAAAGLGLAVIISTALIFYLSGLGGRSPHLLFEEIYAPSGQLSRYIYLIDKAISDGFYEMGIPQEKIDFLSVLPRHKGGYSWDFNSIEARIPRGRSISDIGKGITDRMLNLRIAVQIKMVKRSANEITYNIYYKDFYTHRIRIMVDTCQEPDRLLNPKIGIIIDDLGYDRHLARAFMEFDLPLTFSVLPFTPNTRSIAQKAKEVGRETMLHLPMEPINYPALNPGDGVLLVSMEREEILEILMRDLSEIPFVAGVNNHMGSRFTEDEEKMSIVLGELKARGLYFIDSRTSASSVAFKIAKKMALRTAYRDIFLDNDLSDNALKIQIERLLSLARHKGRAIGIGHPHRETLQLLKKHQFTLNNEAEVVPISHLVN
jgi:polysaccharide deacetylase 2 family uncharacterized protein YibQ